MKMKVYEIPVYISKTNVKELEIKETIFCYKTLLTVRELASNDPIIVVVGDDIIESKNGKKYIKDIKDIFYRYNLLHRTYLEEKGFVPYVLEKDLDNARQVSANEVDSYIENFDSSSYNFLREKAKEKVKSRKKLR